MTDVKHAYVKNLKNPMNQDFFRFFLYIDLDLKIS